MKTITKAPFSISRYLGGILLAIFCIATADAKTAVPSFERMVTFADVIAVAVVVRVDVARYHKTAHARVIEVWKGDTSLMSVSYRAQPAWVCDISAAVVGETVVLFLQRPGEENGLRRGNRDAEFIIHGDGTGRLPVQVSKDKSRVTIPSSWMKAIGIRLERPMSTTETPVVALSDLHMAVRRALSTGRWSENVYGDSHVLSAIDEHSHVMAVVMPDGHSVKGVMGADREKPGYIWLIDIFDTCSRPLVGEPIIRKIDVAPVKGSSDSTFWVVYGKHDFASIEPLTGKVTYWGSD